MLGAGITITNLNTFLVKVTIETQFMDDTMDKSDFSTLMEEPSWDKNMVTVLVS